MRVDDAELRASQAAAFGRAADIYERARPGYPGEALDWLLPAGSPRVLDLGAGTGKLTRLLAERGLDVAAVEPSDGMLEELRRQLPDVPVDRGAAEQLPFEDASFDAVIAAQSWHWVDVPRASAEVARVLRPGGRLGLVWNTRDERVAWVAELSRILERGVSHMDSANPEIGRPFGQIEYFTTEWSSPITGSGLIELVASRSYMIIAPEQERRRIMLDVRNLIDHHPELSGREQFEMPYVTYCSRAHVA